MYPCPDVIIMHPISALCIIIIKMINDYIIIIIADLYIAFHSEMMFNNIKILLLYAMVASSEEDEGFIATLPQDHDYAITMTEEVTTVVVTITTTTTTTTMTTTATTTATTTTTTAPGSAPLTIGDMIGRHTTTGSNFFFK